MMLRIDYDSCNIKRNHHPWGNMSLKLLNPRHREAGSYWRKGTNLPLSNILITMWCAYLSFIRAKQWGRSSSNTAALSVGVQYFTQFCIEEPVQSKTCLQNLTPRNSRLKWNNENITCINSSSSP